MWKSIKKFFKWIADHTGISWVTRKISSGWKWLFGGKAKQNTSQHEGRSDNEKHEPGQVNDQSKDHTTPKTPAPSRPTPTAEPEGLGTPDGDSSVNQSTQEPLKTTTREPAQPTLDEKSQKSVVNKRKEGELKLDTLLNGIVLSLKQALVVQDHKIHNVNTNLTELFIYIKCGKDEYRVVGDTFGNPIGIFSVPIVSIVKKNENGEYLDSNVKSSVNKDVQEMLGLKDDVTTVKVDSISNKPFEGTALEQPNPNVTSHNATQQTVSKETEVKQASGSTTTVLTEQLPEVNSTQELSTPNNEPVKIDTSDQPKSPAVLDKSQESVVNPPKTEEKGKPNNAASNWEVQPEVSIGQI